MRRDFRKLEKEEDREQCREQSEFAPTLESLHLFLLLTATQRSKPHGGVSYTEADERVISISIFHGRH